MAWIKSSKKEAGGGGTASWDDLVGTLVAGTTTVTFTSSKIKTTSVIDVYTDVYGVNPKSITLSNGSATVTFLKRQTNMGVMIRVTDSNAIVPFDINLLHWETDKIWYRYGAEAGSATVSSGIKCYGNDIRDNWIAQSMICIDLTEYDIPTSLTGFGIHLPKLVTTDYAGIIITTGDTKYAETSQENSLSAAQLTRLATLLDTSGLDETNYTWEVSCTSSQLGRYIYIDTMSGLVPDSTSFSNYNNGTWEIIFDGIWFR